MAQKIFVRLQKKEDKLVWNPLYLVPGNPGCVSCWYGRARELEDLNSVEWEDWEAAPAEEEEEAGQEGKVAPERGALEREGSQDPF